MRISHFNLSSPGTPASACMFSDHTHYAVLLSSGNHHSSSFGWCNDHAPPKPLPLTELSFAGHASSPSVNDIRPSCFEGVGSGPADCLPPPKQKHRTARHRIWSVDIPQLQRRWFRQAGQVLLGALTMASVAAAVLVALHRLMKVTVTINLFLNTTCHWQHVCAHCACCHLPINKYSRLSPDSLPVKHQVCRLTSVIDLL